MNILCNTLKLKGTNYPSKWIKVPDTGPYWKACMGFHIFKLIIIWYTNSVQEKYKIILFLPLVTSACRFPLVTAKYNFFTNSILFNNETKAEK